MLATSRSQRWIVTTREAKGGLRLFCVPYAGGGPSVFRTWPDQLPVCVELCCMHLPGRETRVNEPAISELTLLVRELSDAIQPYLDRRYVLFGHSIGALISFELARELRHRHGHEPEHLFVSGCPAPQLPDTDPMFDLPEAEFFERLQRLNGTPPEVMSHPELMAMMAPTLRADFALRDTYAYVAAPPLSCPISVFGGLQDHEVTVEKLDAWREHTNKSFNLHLFAGDHFFIRDAQSPLLDILFRALSELQEIRG